MQGWRCGSRWYLLASRTRSRHRGSPLVMSDSVMTWSMRSWGAMSGKRTRLMRKWANISLSFDLKLIQAERELKQLQFGDALQTIVFENLSEKLFAKVNVISSLGYLVQVLRISFRALPAKLRQVELVSQVVHVHTVWGCGNACEEVAAEVNGFGHLQVCRRQENVINVSQSATKLSCVSESYNFWQTLSWNSWNYNTYHFWSDTVWEKTDGQTKRGLPFRWIEFSFFSFISRVNNALK